MDAEHLRAYLLTLPHVVETMQWGDNLVFWVGDKAIGGKMFSLINLDRGHRGSDEPSLILSYAAGPDRYAELLEREGIVPAPYMARIHWVAAQGWDVFRDAEWRAEAQAAHALTFAKLPKKVLAALTLPVAEQRRLIAEAQRRKNAKRHTGAAAKK